MDISNGKYYTRIRYDWQSLGFIGLGQIPTREERDPGLIMLTKVELKLSIHEFSV